MSRYLLCLGSLALGAALIQGDVRGQQPQPKPTPTPPAQTPSFPSGIDLITVDAVVLDKKGGVIADLTPEDFTILEDGKVQTITSFQAVKVPQAPAKAPVARPRVSTNTDAKNRIGRTFLIVFDDIHLTPFQGQRAKGAVAEFLKSGVREGDSVTLVATGGGTWWNARMESGRDELLTLLKRLEGRLIPEIGQDRITDNEAMRIHVYRDQTVIDRVQRRFDTYGVNPGGSQNQTTSANNQVAGDMDPLISGRATEVYFQATSRNRITLETIERVLNSLAPTKGRKSMILVSQGFIYDPNLDEFKRVLQASRRANVAIYFLDTRGLEGLPVAMTAQFGPAIDSQDIGAAFAETFEEAQGAESVSVDSGGFVIKNTNDLNKGIKRIAEESQAYYLLGYNTTNAAHDGKFRKITLKVSRKGLEVRARKGYYAPLEGKTAVVAKKPGAADPEIQQALDSPYEMGDIPLRMTDYSFDETLLGKASVKVAADVDIRSLAFKEKDGRFVDSIDFLLVVAHRETGEYFQYPQKIDMNFRPETREKFNKFWFPTARDFELAPGGYQAKLVVRDKNSGKVGTLIHDFEVPELSTLRASSLILSDVVQTGETNKQLFPALLARRNFTAGSGSMLYAYFEVFGAEKDKTTGRPRVISGFSIKKVDGATLFEMRPTEIRATSLGKLSRLTGSSIERAEPGEYEFVLTLKDEITGKSLELREPFTVETPAPS